MNLESNALLDYKVYLVGQLPMLGSYPVMTVLPVNKCSQRRVHYVRLIVIVCTVKPER